MDPMKVKFNTNGELCECGLHEDHTEAVQDMIPRQVHGLDVERVQLIKYRGEVLGEFTPEGGLKISFYSAGNAKKLALTAALIYDVYDCCIADAKSTLDEVLARISSRLLFAEENAGK